MKMLRVTHLRFINANDIPGQPAGHEVSSMAKPEARYALHYAPSDRSFRIELLARNGKAAQVAWVARERIQNWKYAPEDEPTLEETSDGDPAPAKGKKSATSAS